MEERGKYLLIILVIGALLFLFKIGERDLWEPDETRYAVVAREMRETGDWVVPHLNGTIYAEKPPLFFWLVNLSTLFFGENTELTNRLPSALAGLMTILMTFLFGSRLFNAKAGFLSGLILATCFFFPQISRWMMLDSLFTLLFLLATYFLYRGMNEKARQRIFFILSGIFMACATLTKGPIGYLPIILFLIYSLICKEFQKVWNRNLLYGSLLSIGLVLAWLLSAIGITGQHYGIQDVWHQTIGRFTEGWKHRQAFYFYFIRFPFGFLPWIIFLPWAVAHGIQGISTEKRKEFLLLFIWFAFIFLFSTLSKGKKDNYLLPLYPAAALLVGQWISLFLSRPEESIHTYGKLWMPVSIFTLFFTASLVIVLSGFFKFYQKGIDLYLSVGVWPLLMLSLGGMLSLFLLAKGWNLQATFCLIAALVFAQIYLAIAVPLRFNELRSMKPFAQKILSKVSAEQELKIWKFQSTGILYYTGKQVEQIKTIDHLL
jgi:4-amino-4-deoxy-L-arabinose transferase-like glycosyltransferase